MSQEAERLTDSQSNKGALEGNKDLDKAKEAIKVRQCLVELVERSF